MNIRCNKKEEEIDIFEKWVVKLEIARAVAKMIRKGFKGTIFHYFPKTLLSVKRG